MDCEAIKQACDDVRNDSSGTVWAAFTYDDKNIVVGGQGENYDDLLALCKDEDRFYGYVRVETGDEMSKRAKFVLITWVGKAVPPLKKAKVSTDKSAVKEQCPAFALEILTQEIEELALASLIEEAKKVGGANYGTGQ